MEHKKQNSRIDFKTYIFFLDPQFNIVWINRSFIKICNKDLSFFVGREIYNFFSKTDIKSTFERVKKTGTSCNSSGTLKLSMPIQKISLKDCYWSFLPYQNDRNMVTGFFFIILNQLFEREALTGLKISTKYNN
ncbi:MAG TPA: hypothetical protein DIW44_11360 [Anaerolineaceae bacterium]|nr:hypothetical protein [Anaerolineaceae bacterium]